MKIISGSIIFVGSVVGTFLYGFLNQLIGKKYSLLLLVPPHLVLSIFQGISRFITSQILQVFWLLVYIGADVDHLYVARFFGGLTGGGLTRTIPLFIAEISENK